MRPWERRLAREALLGGALRGATAAFGIASLVLAIGWLTPTPEADLQPIGAALGGVVCLAALLAACWPVSRVRRAADLDTRLGFGDRLATAWVFRDSSEGLARLQRADAIGRLSRRDPATDLLWRPARSALAVLGVLGVVCLLLVVTPSPQQPVLQQQAAERAAVQRAAERLGVMRLEATAQTTSLTPEQARRLDELLQQAQAALKEVKTQREASAIVARAEDVVTQQLADPNADLRDEALAAMSETLAAEPLTRPLGDALQHEDARASSQALAALMDRADQLSDVERQALSRALDRAANVGRAEPASARALRAAARALEPQDGGQPNPTAASAAAEANGTTAAGEPSRSRAALSSADASLREAIQNARAQAAVNAAAQRLRDVQAQLRPGYILPAQGLGQLPSGDSPEGDNPGDAIPGDGGDRAAASASLGGRLPAGTPIALDAASGGALRVRDPSAQPGGGAGTGASDVAAGATADTRSSGTPAETVFVPGHPGNGPTDQDLVDQPFTIRGAPRPYRDVVGQYAQSSRDYVDRPDVSPAVRTLVKDYFVKLEEGQ